MLTRILCFLLTYLLTSAHVDRATSEVLSGSKEFQAELERLERSAKYKEALALAKRTLKALEKKPKSNNRDIGAARHKVASLMEKLGHLEEAERTYRQNLIFQNATLGGYDEDVAASLNHLGDLVRKRGDLLEAEQLLKLALAKRRRFRKKDDAAIGFSFNNLAALYEDQGRLDVAERLYIQSLSKIQSARGRWSGKLAAPLNNLGLLYQKQGRFAEAEEVFRESLKIRKTSLGETHPDVAISLNNLAAVYIENGDLKNAEQAYIKSLEIFENTFDKDHLNIGVVLGNLAVFYESQGRFDHALERSIRSLEIKEEKLGATHPSVGRALNNLANLYLAKGLHLDAEFVYHESIRLHEDEFGKNHLQTATPILNLAIIYKQLQKYEQSEGFYKRAIEIREEALHSDHPKVREALEGLLELYKTLGRNTEFKLIQERLKGFPPKGTRHIRLYFATNRMSDTSGKFIGRPSKSLTLGQAVIRIPSEEVGRRAKAIGNSLGQLEKATDRKLTAAYALKQVRIERYKNFDDYVIGLKENQRHAANFRKQALVFVHGYNTTFADAMRRVTQVSFDLKYDGTIIPYAWPSQGTITGYFSDNRYARKSVDALVGFLEQLRNSLPDTKLNFLAHSMGNQVLLRALCKIAKKQRKNNIKIDKFGHIISAHADISKTDFESLTACIKGNIDGITLYVNENDLALQVRCLFFFRCRAGNYARGYSSVDVIDTTAMSKGVRQSIGEGFDHDLFVRNTILFNDIARLMLDNKDPVEQRTNEFSPRKDQQNRAYWVYDHTRDPSLGAHTVTND